jgi:protein gp37
MAELTKIEWTDSTWNPVTGCTKVSAGCAHCYAERLARRLKAMGNPRYQRGFSVTLHPDLLWLPLRWKSPRMIFVNSMSDLFHEAVPDAFIERVFDVMLRAPRHQFQVLTKRGGRLAALAPKLPWPPNVWQGVTVESAAQLGRIAQLQQIPAAVRFLSLEPLLGPIPVLPLEGIDQVILGGESGPAARLLQPDWVRGIRDQCQRRGVAFFFKQWGGFFPKAKGDTLDGRQWKETPRPWLRTRSQKVREIFAQASGD